MATIQGGLLLDSRKDLWTLWGVGSPVGTVLADRGHGSTYLRLDGGAGDGVWVKTAPNGNPAAWSAVAGAGPPGPTGPAGAFAMGRDGAVGRDSFTPGPPGPHGVQGVPGVSAPMLDGRAGRDSFTPGPPGVAGAAGAAGAVGLSGPPGLDGKPGALGLPAGPYPEAPTPFARTFMLMGA